jgi:sRNA-binding carbon storage regulator CsrA
MLVLSRKPKESIRLTVPPSDEPQVIDISVVEMNSFRSKLGITADRSVGILRTELVDLPVVGPDVAKSS